MLQRDYPGQVCSVARSLEVIGERWSLLILRDAVIGLERFEEFQESLGIASNVLAKRLKLLCEEGVLEWVADPERPGRPKYVLTDKGRELAPALLVLMKWGDRHYPTRRAATADAACRLRRQCRRRFPLRPLRSTGRSWRDRVPSRARSSRRALRRADAIADRVSVKYVRSMHRGPGGSRLTIAIYGAPTG